MSDRRTTVVLVVALVVALGAGLGVYSLLRSARTDAGQTVAVVVAARDIPDGRVIEPADVRLSSLAASALPEGAYTSPDSVIGRVTRIPVLATEPLIPARLAPVGASGSLEVRIARGKRAMPVRIEDAAATVIQPNSRVDVILITALANGAPSAARLILSNKRVLSVGGQMERSATELLPAPTSTIATIEVTPAEAEELAMAMTSGRLQFVLRGFGDLDQDPAPAVAAPTPISNDPPRRRSRRRREEPQTVAPAPPSTPRPSSPPPVAPTAAAPGRRDSSAVVQIYRGPAVTRMTFPKTDTIRP